MTSYQMFLKSGTMISKQSIKVILLNYIYLKKSQF